MVERLLNVVDENGNLVGTESREKIHRDGLLHCIVHIWIYNRKGELLFQHRAPDMETYPDLLDASVGGHVEIGRTYEQAAIQEMKEETGHVISLSDLHPLGIRRTKKSIDPSTNTTPYHLIASYAYQYSGSVDDLRIEDGKGAGFEFWPIETILKIPETQRSRFIPSIFDPSTLAIFRSIQTLLKHP